MPYFEAFTSQVLAPVEVMILQAMRKTSYSSGTDAGGADGRVTLLPGHVTLLPV